MIEIKSTFTERFNDAITMRGMKPADIARKTGIAEATISQYRSGYSKPKKERLVKLANALGVDPSWLMGLDVPMVSAPVDYVATLPNGEQILIEQYRKADVRTRKAVQMLLEMEEQS